MDAAHNEYALRLRRKLVNDGLEMAKLIAGEQLRFAVIDGLQRLQIRHGLERDDLSPPRDINHQIPGDGIEIGPSGGNSLPFLGRISPCQHFGTQVFQLCLGGCHAAQARAQRGLLGQYYGLKPVELRLSLIQMALPQNESAPLPVSSLSKKDHKIIRLSSRLLRFSYCSAFVGPLKDFVFGGMAVFEALFVFSVRLEQKGDRNAAGGNGLGTDVCCSLYCPHCSCAR